MIERLRAWILARVVGGVSSPELTFFADSYLVSVPSPVSLQWQVKDPDYSAKNADSRLHLNMHTPLTQWSRSELTMLLSWYREGTYQETSSHANLSGNTWPKLSQLAEPLWADPGVNLPVELVSARWSPLKKRIKKTQPGNDWWNTLPEVSQVSKKPSIITYHYIYKCSITCHLTAALQLWEF